MAKLPKRIVRSAFLGWFVAASTFGITAFAEGAHEHGAAEHAGASEHATTEHSEHAEEPPQFEDINWYYGLFGEADGVEPTLLTRPTGMPVPFVSTLFNWAILIALIAMVAKKQVPAALAKRKSQIVQGMDDAAKMLSEAKAKLAELDAKLSKIDTEIDRIKTEMAQAGERERERILAEAVERRVRMERDAQRLIETELEAARESLRRFVVDKALLNAKEQITARLSPEDQSRFFDDALAHLKKLPSRTFGGQV
jgi:F-type H+-transporting ATPase subunit b